MFGATQHATGTGGHSKKSAIHVQTAVLGCPAKVGHVLRNDSLPVKGAARQGLTRDGRESREDGAPATQERKRDCTQAQNTGQGPKAIRR